MKKPANLLKNLPPPDAEEFFETLLDQPDFRLERIVSQGHVTPPGEWYDQDRDEWILLLSGGATLLFEHEEQPVRLEAGDHLHLPAHVRHRVEWTDPAQSTIWLALHFRGKVGAAAPG